MIDVYRGAERLMSMDNAAWRRHCNPWSGITRIAGLPLLCLAIWSRVWLGWGALFPVVLVFAFIWLNPRMFPEPARFDSWFAKGVLGERIFIEYRAQIPASHRRAAHLLTWASVPGALIMIAGLVWLWWEAAVFGMLLTIVPKLWFVDRMVWLFEIWRAEGRAVPGVDAHEL